MFFRYFCNESGCTCTGFLILILPVFCLNSAKVFLQKVIPQEDKVTI